MITKWLDNKKTVAVVYDSTKAKLVIDSSFRRIYKGENAFFNAEKDGIDFINKRKKDKTIWFK